MHANSARGRRQQKPRSRLRSRVVSAPRFPTEQSLVAHLLQQSPRAVDLHVSPLRVASPHGVTVWLPRTLVRVLPPLLTPSLLPPLLLLLLPLPPRQHLLSVVATFLPTFVAPAVLLLVVAGESVRPQHAKPLLVVILVPLLLADAMRHLAAISVRSARRLPLLEVVGNLLRATVPLLVSASLSRAIPRRQLAVRSTCRAGSVLVSRV